VRFCLRFDLIRFFPTFLSPFLLVNVTKILKRDKFNEFRVRGWKMLRVEGFRLVKRTVKRILPSPPTMPPALPGGAARKGP
jgi:hypothetical protein